MRPQLKHQRALVLGGTGVVGQEVLRGLSQRGVPAVFTYLQHQEKARELDALGHRGGLLDLQNSNAVNEAASALAQVKPPITLLIHCAAVLQSGSVEDISEQALLS